MSDQRWSRRLPLLGLLLLLSSCAFANRSNRPVWNAFEATMVPESDGAFYAALPLTVPLGLGAILVDTFVAHPIQVVDDAWDDTTNVWDGIDFEAAYYTESASLPFRAVWSPIVFAGSFLGRSVFDIRSQDDVARDRELAEQRRRARVLQWLERVAAGERVGAAPSLFGDVLDAEIARALQDALGRASAEGRIRLYALAASSGDPAIVDWLAALADPSAVVRYHVIGDFPQALELPAEIAQRLLEDPDEAVRERARRRFAQ